MHHRAQRIESISFASEGLRTNGFLHLPETESPPVIIGSHGLFSDGNSPKQVALAKKCTDIGLAYFRFDHRGCGKSQGNFEAVTSLSGRAADLSAALNTMQEHPATGNRFGIFGSSMGGATGLTVAAGNLQIQAIVTVAAPLRSAPILEAGKKTGDLRGLPLSFYEKQLHFDISEKVSEISTLMIVHGDSDETVPVADAHELYSKAGDPKKLIIQKKGDHSMSSLHHQVQFMKSAVKWFQTYLSAETI